TSNSPPISSALRRRNAPRRRRTKAPSRRHRNNARGVGPPRSTGWTLAALINAIAAFFQPGVGVVEMEGRHAVAVTAAVALSETELPLRIDHHDRFAALVHAQRQRLAALAGIHHRIARNARLFLRPAERPPAAAA